MEPAAIPSAGGIIPALADPLAAPVAPAPEARPPTGPHAPTGGRKVGSGRPAGVQCKCKCCGALGFYKRSCGRKHQCLIGKCGPLGGDQAPAASSQPDSSTPNTMYQVLCASCGVPLQFALPNHPAYIVCYNCNAKMVIQPMQDGQAGEPGEGQPQLGGTADLPAALEAPPPVQSDNSVPSTDPNSVFNALVLKPDPEPVAEPPVAQVGEKRPREEDEELLVEAKKLEPALDEPAAFAELAGSVD